MALDILVYYVVRIPIVGGGPFVVLSRIHRTIVSRSVLVTRGGDRSKSNC